ncbi:hypothetical protein A374_01344 [Fictibacillus macauensis ZFHKF-1]|uniref:Knr4/Smi1-like domain-containing protein n=1 Tax=Fictibacillus macauensis ZFHKF-1 TaxID=1196324 RepID=I8AN73_9BACL|nr:SMI1/KNR4 family protein [Fictibacillus macauensis]EIT87219.1 hypothetical protein A374_01344 [Fictibacillus macauensis ZFHKF-1]
MKIENKLSLLGITSKYGNNSSREVEKVEQTIGLTLPDEYKEFLHTFGTKF